ncbi:Cysteine-rich receptor-like protein kinase 2 [Hibiscus syriacus]|uniref:Cysteine-rich receptor-like protein kinase 2 n=1 Tax=Hibiscus syriacus TaxID=106335 RepID=A0A6A2ZJV0_HIBSY|nr:Cysteine-rich receptor-like protein kinase 2 [Hibiscus syriacus]
MDIFSWRYFGSLALLGIVQAQPRAQILSRTCGSRDNRTQFVPNFVLIMEELSGLTRQFGWGTAVNGACCSSSVLSERWCPSFPRRVLHESRNYSFYDEYLGPYDKVMCGNTSRKGSNFQASAREAVSRAVTTALDNGGHYAKAHVDGSGLNETAYVLVNCWRTLNRSACEACYENASAAMLRCLPWSEGRALYTGCFMRYSDTDFLNKEPGNGSSRGTIITIVVSTVSSLLVLAVLAAIGAYIWKRRYIQKKRDQNDADQWVKVLRDSSLNFKYSTLEKATGTLPDGREIAVKRLFFNSRHRAADFFNEINIISSVEHKNLVRLLGCSCSGPESLLVYEFLPNKSLDSFIFDPSRSGELTWEKRYQIIIGTVEGLAYLHENPTQKIIHRDIKASNILLDLKFRAKIADFGLARAFDEDRSHISTAVAGTLGYMAPEYLAKGQLTDKADVYSFGVLLLEMVTGKQNNGSRHTDYSDSIISVAWNHFQSGTAEEIYDPNIMPKDIDQCNSVKSQIYRVLHIGLLCTQENRSLRPSMSKVLQMLTKKDEDLPAPTIPPFMDEQTMEFNETSENGNYPLNAGGTNSGATIDHSSFHPR